MPDLSEVNHRIEVTASNGPRLTDTQGKALIDGNGSYGAEASAKRSDLLDTDTGACLCGNEVTKGFIARAWGSIGKDLGCVLGPLHPVYSEVWKPCLTAVTHIAGFQVVSQLRSFSGQEEVSVVYGAPDPVCTALCM